MKNFYKLVKEDNKVILKELSLSHQSFSGTDYGKSKDDIGIVFPYDIDSDIKNGLSASSIIDHHNDDSHLIKHTEVRVCNKGKDKLEYEELETIGLVIQDLEDDKVSEARMFIFDEKQEEELFYYEAEKPIKLSNEIITLMNVYDKFKYTFVDIKEDLVKKKETTSLTTYSSIKEGTDGNLFDFATDNIEKESLFNFEIEEKIYEATKEWSDKFKMIVDTIELESYYIEWFALKDKDKDRIGGILEMMFMDALNCDIFDEEAVLNFRKKYDYNKEDIEESSIEVMKIVDGKYGEKR